jgi:outer membrane protein assembly factor BamE (lipoprotein component of BamABCDE complex)
MTRLVCLFLAVSLLSGCVDRGAAPKAPAVKKYTRAEFRELLVGKTPDEVIAAVGKPDDTAEIGGQKVWYYSDRSADPVTGKPDVLANVWFGSDGRVERVSY